MEELLGRSLGPYQLLERLEPTGPFPLFRAVDRRLFNRPVTVTVFPLPADDDERIARFERAAEALVELRHPHIQPLQDFGEFGQYGYAVAPRVEGLPLTALLGHPQPRDVALRLVAALCDALDYAHRRGLVHRAIAPATIQVTTPRPDELDLEEAWPLFTEFGYAGIDEAVLTHPALAPYQPPEQGLGHDYGRADLYALAAVLAALLTGAPLPADPQVREAVLPPELAGVLQRALSATPAERFGSGAEFVAALQEATQTERRTDDADAPALLEEARAAVTAGRFRAAGRAYGAYLELRPDDDLARRELTAIQGRLIRPRRSPPGPAPTATEEAPPGDTNTPDEAPSAEGIAGELRPLLPLPEPVATPAEEAGQSDEAAPTPPAPRWSLFRRRGAAPESTPPAASVTATSSVPAPAKPLPSTYRANQRPAAGVPLKPLVAPARERERLVLPSALAALVLVLAVALTSGVLLKRYNRGTATPGHVGGSPAVGSASVPTGANGVALPSQQSVTATAGPAGNVIATIPIAPTSPPPTPTPVPPPTLLPPVLTDQFGDPNSGFPRQPGEQQNPAYWNGEYIIVVPTPGNYTIADLAGKTFGDLVLEVDARAVGPLNGGSYGLVFHKVATGGGIDEYFVQVDPQAGAARLVHWNGSQALELLPMTPNAAIKKGEEVNHITIICKANLITLFVNGVQIAQVTDTGPVQGSVGLRADAGTAQFEAHFDNFIIRPAR